MAATDPNEMSFLEHLEQLRRHIIRSLVAVLLAMLLAFFAKAYLFDGVLMAPKNQNFITYRAFCFLSHALGFQENLCLQMPPIQLINTSMAGQFTMHLWVSFVAGVVLAFPYCVWELWRFVRPALYENERQGARGLVFWVSVLFVLGALFGYFVLTPLSVNFLGNYSVSGEIGNFIDVRSYISLITMLVLSCGLLFELPVAIYFLSRIGLVTPQFLRRYRRHAIVLNLLLSAIITPPDLVSQIIVALPVALLYEVGIWISARVHKKYLRAHL
ncbi:MAG: twin-arginine translocase subunit TatC [Flavobacteriales bacterium]|nr:twin-arginine translocase subunit TatC [Flavobacteriales bacterium]MDW8432360.1 twin-arginine translocase subunit TatC [Flavobacteriales bacterium]